MRRYITVGLVGLLIAAVTGCDDSTGLDLNPILVNDTVTVVAPLPQNAGLPTALDITSDGSFGVMGGRFPEQIGDALQWDFVVRMVDGAVALVPPEGVGVVGSRASITPPIAGANFEELREAPGQSTFISDSAVVMVAGNVHVARSREVFSDCVQFAKLQPLAVDPVAGSLEIRIVTNERCSDPRLVEVD